MGAVTLKVPEEVEAAYAEQNPKDPRKAMELQLARFKGVTPERRAVILSEEARRRVEKVYARPIEDDLAFAAWLEGVVGLKVGSAEIPLSANQLKILAAYAAQTKKPLTEAIKERVELGLRQILGV